MRRRIRVVFAVAVLAVIATGCGSSEPEDGVVVGVVSEVSGELPVVDTFVILDENGDSYRFAPEPGLLFHGGPLSHLRDHIVGGEPVTVTFEVQPSGIMTATHVEHSG